MPNRGVSRQCLLGIPHARSSASDWVSVSIGIASLQPGGAPKSAARGGAGEPDGEGEPGAASPSGFQISQELFERADQALYAAKEGGRNQVRVHR